ncbi:isoprenylcysteine carboxylmethyltransferase family protein [Pseudomonas stutzeri]|uniref:Protein-S-isoprenylcysteine methyltransferase n=1 Tax=Stutzerimonas stutzeri KOS6 TaxID=1218352 RepID=A0A061JKQ8_STUST|nr:isoprenylcysteine carboxylmethyltransferase family protein [Stutzerimonas stutzeri]EWC40246.1 protein-S-isoprenylcysteine methyltransferase [Stutzerimonas stutzeri KOS6]MBK3868453.1 isoprenylcysteine carboxylmethyltransferase family protein [Stutzerimonas stutzeri]
MFKRATGVILPPPVIYLLFLAAAWLLESVLPIALPRNLWTHYLGWGLIDAGVLLMLWAGLLMLWHRTTVNPYGRPARLVEEGPFRFSRNPIYLADSLIYVGIALLWGSLWPWLLLPLVIFTMQRGVIVHEERLLGQLFGAEYHAYCGRVRRWL